MQTRRADVMIILFSRNICYCGPPRTMDSVEKILAGLNVNEELINKEAV